LQRKTLKFANQIPQLNNKEKSSADLLKIIIVTFTLSKASAQLFAEATPFNKEGKTKKRRVILLYFNITLPIILN
jgi:hypothetical protein